MGRRSKQEFRADTPRPDEDGTCIQLTSMDPLVAPGCRVLILGSMPGQVSLDSGEYYAHPQNRFWRVMEAIFGVSTAGSYDQRTSHLTLAGVAVWDVLKHCSRDGSLDSSILADTEVPNDLMDFMKRHRTIDRVVFNGRKAAKSFHRLVAHDLPDELRNRLSCDVAPSTSPANARATLPVLIDAWRKAVAESGADEPSG